MEDEVLVSAEELRAGLLKFVLIMAHNYPEDKAKAKETLELIQQIKASLEDDDQELLMSSLTRATEMLSECPDKNIGTRH